MIHWQKKSPYILVNLLCGLREAAVEGACAAIILDTTIHGKVKPSYISAAPQLGYTQELNISYSILKPFRA